MADRIQFRRDSADNWDTYNPILADGEIGIENDTKRFKLGDGVTAWKNLTYSSVTLLENPEEYLKLYSVTNITYDNDSVITSETYENGAKILFSYNVNGSLDKQEYTDTDGTTVGLTKTYSYDENNNLKTITRSFS